MLRHPGVGPAVFSAHTHVQGDRQDAQWPAGQRDHRANSRDDAQLQAARVPAETKVACSAAGQPALGLQTRNLGRHWGSFKAVDALTLSFAPGLRHALIGPNGAGKSTLVNLLGGALAAGSGRIYLDGRDITGLSQHQRVKLGISRTFQINNLFPGLTVLESVLLAIGERRARQHVWRHALASEQASISEALDLLETLRLGQDAATLTRHLPYGKQRVLELALALAARPRILLLDEPAAGIPGDESAELFALLAALPGHMTVILVEHNMDLVFRHAQRITVLMAGTLLCQGDPVEVAGDARVREVYLGHA
ncbi:MAG: ABC transporter ATP-binding protein [Janthinobacterium lividum]